MFLKKKKIFWKIIWKKAIAINVALRDLFESFVHNLSEPTNGQMVGKI